MTEEEIYQEVYGKLVNKVLPAFQEATIELEQKGYQDIGGFLMTSLGGINATVLISSINATADEAKIPRSKARKRVLKSMYDRSNLFLQRLNELHRVAKEQQST